MDLSRYSLPAPSSSLGPSILQQIEWKVVVSKSKTHASYTATWKRNRLERKFDILPETYEPSGLTLEQWLTHQRDQMIRDIEARLEKGYWH